MDFVEGAFASVVNPFGTLGGNYDFDSHVNIAADINFVKIATFFVVVRVFLLKNKTFECKYL